METTSNAQSSKDLHKEEQRNDTAAGESMWVKPCFCTFRKMDGIMVYRTLMEKSWTVESGGGAGERERS